MKKYLIIILIFIFLSINFVYASSIDKLINLTGATDEYLNYYGFGSNYLEYDKHFVVLRSKSNSAYFRFYRLNADEYICKLHDKNKLTHNGFNADIVHFYTYSKETGKFGGSNSSYYTPSDGFGNLDDYDLVFSNKDVKYYERGEPDNISSTIFYKSDVYQFDPNNMPEFPYVEIIEGKYYPVDYQIVVKKDNSIMLFQSETPFYALEQDGVNYIYVENDEFEDNKYVYKYVLNNDGDTWIPVQNRVDYAFELSVGLVSYDIDYFDEFIFVSDSISNYETGEVVFDKTTEIDISEPYIRFVYPNDMYAHEQQNIEFKVEYKVPVGGNSKHRPIISNSTNFQLLEHNYNDVDGYYEGYFVFTSDVQEGYTKITASYSAEDFDDSVFVTTYYDPYIVDENGDGIDDNTNLPIQQGVINADVASLKQKFEDKLKYGILENSMKKLENINTEKGAPPVISINLNEIFNAGTKYINNDIENPFNDEETTFIDFGILEDITFMNVSVVDYFRDIIAAGFIWLTFMYVWRKIVPSKAVV